jgi:hypothetical protein
MKAEYINRAVAEANRFIAAAKALEAARMETYQCGGTTYHVRAPRESGAVRRASMDLTRSLAAMRRSS